MPKVSVIIPVYNVEKYLRKCLDSVIHQTLTDIEIICVNDGSTDNSPDIINEYTKKDARIKIINQKNSGQSIARNTGIEAAHGEFIGFVDSDDWIDKNYFEKLYNTAIKNNADIACATIVRKRESSQKYRVFYSEEKICTTLKDKISECGLPKCCYVWNKLYKSGLVKSFEFKTGKMYEDVYWTPEILKRSQILVTVPDISYYYRVRKNSTVKNLKSKKRQEDLYKAQKFLIKFFDENNLQMNKSEKNITKSIIYAGKIPVLKIKEFDNIETFLLFNILPVFRRNNKNLLFDFRDIDSHYVFAFGNSTIKIKHKANAEIRKVQEFGLNREYRDKKIIASLTSFPQRINYVSVTIKQLLTQSLKPDELILWLAEEQFPNKEGDLPQNLLELKNFGLSIKWCNDIKSYKKLIPALKEFPKDIIITFDDDICYSEDVIKDLYDSFLKEPESIHTNRAWRMIKNKAGGFVFVRNAKMILKENMYKKASFQNCIIGCGGVLYPPHCLNSQILNEECFTRLIPTQDDIYFWAMAVLNRTKIKIVNGYSKSVETIPETQKFGLCKINNSKGTGLSGQQALEIITKEFPQIMDILSKEEQEEK